MGGSCADGSATRASIRTTLPLLGLALSQPDLARCRKLVYKLQPQVCYIACRAAATRATDATHDR
eukprot:726827-Prymnesium_polylepis.2